MCGVWRSSPRRAGAGTTFGRTLAARLGVPFHELDSIHWGAGWTETSAAELRHRVEPIVAGEAWVVDGSYRGKLGDLVLDAADTVVWLDLPRRVWLTRLVRRTLRRILLREELWIGDRASRFAGRSSARLAVRLRAPHSPVSTAAMAPRARALPVARLRTRREVDTFLRSVSRPLAQPVSDTEFCQGETVPSLHQSLHRS